MPALLWVLYAASYMATSFVFGLLLDQYETACKNGNNSPVVTRLTTKCLLFAVGLLVSGIASVAVSILVGVTITLVGSAFTIYAPSINQKLKLI